MAKSLEERLKAMTEKRCKVLIEGGSDEKEVLVDYEKEPVALTVSRLSPMLPSVGDDKRAMANAILRSPLFGVVKTGQRKYEKKILKVTVQGLSLTVTGEQLDQSDFDVFLEILHRNQGLPLGSVIKFTAGSLLKAINRNVGKSDYVWLEDSLYRLATYSIELGDGKRFYQGALLHDKYRNEETREYAIVINPKIAVFFADGLWMGLSVKERSELKGKQLALWLHGFYSTHDEPFAYKVETLKTQCGSKTGQLYEFRRTLKKALSDLSSVTGWTCLIDEKTDLVHVKKTKGVGHE